MEGDISYHSWNLMYYIVTTENALDIIYHDLSLELHVNLSVSVIKYFINRITK